MAVPALFSVGAQAASFTVGAFDPSEYVGIDASQIEDFETYVAGQWNESTVTDVGTFTTVENAGEGSGSTCTGLGGDCTELYLSDRDVNGQGNITPTNGSMALNANDTLGMVWNASLDGAIAFNDILFGIRDAADQNNTTVEISLLSTNGVNLTTPVTHELTNLSNSESLLVTLSLAEQVTSATLRIVSSRLNDSFTFDGGALTTDFNRISQVPLPSAAWLFISAIGGAGFLRRLRGKCQAATA